MSERSDRPSEVLGALPHRRPNRRSEKRSGATTAKASEKRSAGTTTKVRTKRSGAATAKAPPPRAARKEQPPPPVPPSPPQGAEIIATAVQAAAELAEIGLSATARAIREALARLPRP